MSLYKDVQKAAARKQGVDVKEPAEVTMSNILDGPIKRPDESKLFKTVEERCADARSHGHDTASGGRTGPGGHDTRHHRLPSASLTENRALQYECAVSGFYRGGCGTDSKVEENSDRRTCGACADQEY